MSAGVLVAGLCGCACTLEREGGRERRAGVYVSVGCVKISLDFLLCTFSPIILRKTKKEICFSVMFYTYAFYYLMNMCNYSVYNNIV